MSAFFKEPNFYQSVACSASTVQNLYIISEFGPYLWKSLHFWQMGAIIKTWTSPLPNPKSVCSGMWWLALPYRGMRSRCVVCLLLEWKRALQLSHVGILCLTHSKGLMISSSKIVVNAKTSPQIGRNLTVPLLTIVWGLFFKNKLPSIRDGDPAALIGI